MVTDDDNSFDNVTDVNNDIPRLVLLSTKH